MARQNNTPVQFNRTTRKDRRVGMTSGRAGEVLPIDFIPVLRGDSVAGSFQATFDLAEMPKPLMNAVQANVQAWFVPKSAFPQFSGYDEFMASYHGEQIKALGQADRDPPPFFAFAHTQSTGTTETSRIYNSAIYKTLGVHLGGWTQEGLHADLFDAYSLIWNFRAAAHSSRIPMRPYFTQDHTVATAHAPAFWATTKFPHVVPDYERALIVGALDLDVAAGQLPISGLGIDSSVTQTGTHSGSVRETDGSAVTYDHGMATQNGLVVDTTSATSGSPEIFAEMANQTMSVTLADIDKARTTQAFAKLRTAYAGNDATGFDNDDAIVAELMQGFRVPEDMFKRPWLLDSKRVTFGMVERHATDAANLEQSVTQGRASATLSLNVPQQETGGYIIITAEILPERLFERQGDPSLIMASVDQYPNALRDVQRPEPVDMVPAWRVDARHSSGFSLYGYEPMNAKWDRDFTTLGGKFYQADPENPFREARAGIWLAEVVDPEFTADHYVAPSPFPHDVFADTLGDAVEVAFRRNCAIRGLTQIGDVLAENNDDYAAIQGE